MFNADRFNAQEKPENIWMQLLALYTGARRVAIVQLKISDFTEYKANHWSVHFDEEFDKVGREREIPLHDDLIAMGLIDYIHDVKSLKLADDNIFPHIPDSENGKSHTFGNRFGEEKTALGIAKGGCFHTLRTTLISTLALNNCLPRPERAFVGHATGEKLDVHEKHYIQISLGVERLAKEVLPCIDFSIIGFSKVDWKYTKGASISYINSIVYPKKTIKQNTDKQKLKERQLVQKRYAENKASKPDW
jgi:integrase